MYRHPARSVSLENSNNFNYMYLGHMILFYGLMTCIGTNVFYTLYIFVSYIGKHIHHIYIYIIHITQFLLTYPQLQGPFSSVISIVFSSSEGFLL